MTGLPVGEVTLLFTDIEGSTRLVRALGDRYAEVLTEHRRLLRCAFAHHGGVEVDTQGDSFFVAFSDPLEAIVAAEDAQRALAANSWPETELRVRMGLHTGFPLLVDGHYFGIDVHRGARIAAAAHGGQVIVSERTRDLVAEQDGSAITLRDLGRHQLKDLPETERLYQLVLANLPSSFPPPRVLEEAIEAAGLPDYSLPPAEVPCPYKGLLPFEPEDNELFFGRERLVEHLDAKLGRSGFLAVLGPSGSGKSSVVRAGLVPSRPDTPSTVIVSPGERPLTTLNQSRAAPVIVVDQFEEIFTLCRDEDERFAFVEELLDRSQEGRVIVALRADFYGDCAAFPRLAAELEERHLLIGPMSEEELRRAIERPAEQVGLVLEPGLVDTMLRDVSAQPGALPLLSHSLLETWKRRSGRMLTVIGYLQSGGVQGAIAKTAETVFRDQLSSDQQTLARSIFLRLTQIGGDAEDTRRRVSTVELVPHPEQQADVDEVLRTLVEARLVTIDGKGVELSHEALIRHWPRLTQWLDEDREGRLVHRRLTEAAQEWEALDRDSGGLLRGARLASTIEWATANDDELNQLERDFLAASRRAGERAVRRLRAGIATLALLLLLAIAAGVVAFHQSIVSKHEATLATARALTEASAASLSTDPERSILLALKAIDTFRSTSGGVPREAVENLHSAMEADRLRLVFNTPASQYVAFSPNGQLAATAGGVAHAVDLWSTRTGRRILALPTRAAAGPDLRFSPNGSTLYEHASGVGVAGWSTRTGRQTLLVRDRGPLTNLALSPDGRRIAATSFDGSLTVWNTHTGRQVMRVSAPPGLCGTSFSPDGKQIAAAMCFGSNPQASALVWDSRTGRRLLTIGGRTGANSATLDVAYSPDGRELATVANDGKGQVWNARNGQLLTTLVGHTGWVFAVKFSPDGRRIATGSGDATARIWDARTGRQLLVLAGHSQGVYDLAFSPRGNELLTGSTDGTARIWDMRPQGSRDALTIPGQSGFKGALSVGYSPDGRMMAIGGGGSPSAALWDAATGRRMRILRNKGDVYATAFSPNGRRVLVVGAAGASIFAVRSGRMQLRLPVPRDALGVSGSWTPNGRSVAVGLLTNPGAVLVWNSQTGKLVRKFAFPPNGVIDSAFSPDGTRIAAAGAGSVAKLWDFHSGRLLATLVGHKNTLTSVAFSPDGTRLATTSFDGTAKLWDGHSGKLLSTIRGTSSGTLWDVAFSPEGKTLATAGDDTKVELWDAASGKQLLTLPGATRAVQHVAFSPDGTRLAAASADGSVRAYILPLNALMNVARFRLTRSWTPAECHEFLNTNHCPPRP
jgi:WD40 repeat protein/class 3 adenylate cyclase